MTIEVNSQVIDDITNKIRTLSRSTMNAIGVTVKSDLQLGFKNEQDPSGKPWKPLKASTIKARKKRGSESKILQDTGNLKKSLNFRVKSSSKVTIGYGMDYSIYHQATRKILPTEDSELDIEEIQDIILRGLKL